MLNIYLQILKEIAYIDRRSDTIVETIKVVIILFIVRKFKDILLYTIRYANLFSIIIKVNIVDQATA